MYHKSHDKGVDFDVQLIRGDGRELKRSVTIFDPSCHEPTQRLVTLIEELGKEPAFSAVKLILTAGDKILKGQRIWPDRHHVHHLHIRLEERL